MTTPVTVPLQTIKSWHHTLGQLPPGDVPGAWYMSVNKAVIQAFEEHRDRQRKWNDMYAEFLKLNELPPDTKYVSHSTHFVGAVPPAGVTSTQWLRADNEGKLIPRKKTKAEKESRSNQLWDELQELPDPVIPGMPQTLITSQGTIFKPTFRKPAQAVLALLPVNPSGSVTDEKGNQIWRVGEEWSRLKLSTFHLLREHQETT